MFATDIKLTPQKNIEMGLVTAGKVEDIARQNATIGDCSELQTIEKLPGEPIRSLRRNNAI
ncbi:unnamed protein product [Nezara viridula]|uniref:Uncharacterized protein n=1 Tax=Nezara viridula TaxID=85310 RepID=A0A9P0EDQ7_NEZVI|nr:unnamed protein product [Nezara viridula]